MTEHPNNEAVSDAMVEAGMSYLRSVGSLSMIDLSALYRVMARAARPVDGLDEGGCYTNAFYEMAELLGVNGARSISPKAVYDIEILPRLRELLVNSPVDGLGEQGEVELVARAMARYELAMGDPEHEVAQRVDDQWILYEPLARIAITAITDTTMKETNNDQ